MENVMERRTNAAWLLFKLCMVMVFFLIAVQVGLHKGRMLERARHAGAAEAAGVGPGLIPLNPPLEKGEAQGRFECAVCHGF